ncbi:MAG: class II glutamine amidotransferase [Conexivisphaera sp.]
MCRMLVAIGRFGAPELRSMLAALSAAAAHDPYGEALYGERSHGDGWGMLVARLDGSAALHHRSVRPIYSSDPGGIVPEWADGSPVLMVAHARAASEGTPVDLAAAHPVHASSRWGDLYVAHNGSFDRGRLDALLGEAAPHSDTWAAALLLASKVRGSISRGDLEWLIGMESTGANLGIALLGPGGPQLVVGSHYALLGDDMDGARERYYRLYECARGAGTFYASSTVVELHTGTGGCRIVDNGEFHNYAGSGEPERWRL